MNGVTLQGEEEEALYVILKAREDLLAEPLPDLLRRLERALFGRLTIEELEQLPHRYPASR